MIIKIEKGKDYTLDVFGNKINPNTHYYKSVFGEQIAIPYSAKKIDFVLEEKVGDNKNNRPKGNVKVQNESAEPETRTGSRLSEQEHSG